jgi:TonB family protein
VGPLTLGLRRPVLLVPSGFLETAEPGDVEAALGHELAHIRRRDFGKNLLYELVSLGVSYHPAMRRLKTQLRQSRELVCDAMAAEFVTTREHYARSLLRLASLMAGRRPGVPVHAIGIFDANILERRVMSLTGKVKETRGLLRVGCVAVCVVVGFAACGSALALRLDVNEPPPAVAASGQAADIVPAKIIYRKPPVYPAKARAEKNTVDGPCVLEMTVGVDGVPTNVHVVKSLRADYDQSAMDAVREWRFAPAMKDGRPVAAETHVEINYSIK